MKVLQSVMCICMCVCVCMYLCHDSEESLGLACCGQQHVEMGLWRSGDTIAVYRGLLHV